MFFVSSLFQFCIVFVCLASAQKTSVNVYYFRMYNIIFFFCMAYSENRILHFIIIIISVPPTKAELVGHKSGGELQVREQDEVELKCIIHNARPKPDIIWYLGDKELVKGI